MKNKKESCQICQKELLIIKINGFTLCYNHSREYLHQKEYPETSVHKKTFEKLGLGQTQ